MPYSNSMKINLSSDDVSTYDLNVNQISSRPDMGLRVSRPVDAASVKELTNISKIGLNSYNIETPAGKIKNRTVVDKYSNTRFSQLHPNMARNQPRLSLPDYPTTSVMPNEYDLKMQSINSGATEHFKNYSVLNFTPHGVLEDKSKISEEANKVLIKRLDGNTNTYNIYKNYNRLNYNSLVIAPTYEKKSKFENNAFLANPAPSILLTMKTLDKIYIPEQKLL